MKSLKKQSKNRRGIALVLAMIFVALLASLSVSMVTMSSANAQMANNHHSANNALRAAYSGLQCAKYTLKNLPVIETNTNLVSEEQAGIIWQSLCTKLTETGIGNAVASSVVRFVDSDSGQLGDMLTVGPVEFDNKNISFTITRLCF
jgi:Tfp pilus assembly protein PilX